MAKEIEAKTPPIDRYKLGNSISDRMNFQAMMQTMGMLPVLIIICIFFFLMTSRFGSLQNVTIIVQQASINTMLAAGMTFVILTGGIDLSVGSILAASAMVAVYTSLIPGFGMIGVPAAIVCGLVFGLFNGALVSLVGLPPFIVTLGSLTAVRGIARLLGNDKTIFNTDMPFAFLGEGSIFGIPWLVIVAFLIVVISWFVLRRTVLGVHIYSVGGNPDAARLSGIKVWRILLIVYGTSGGLAGLAGAMSAARLYAANGMQLGQSYELDAIAAVILGGTSLVGGIGSVWGTLVGALIIAVLSNGLILTGVSDIWQYIIKGLIIILAVTIDRVRLRNSART